MDKSPDAFRTISEVAEVLETPAHVLRFWESRFPQIKPVKRAGGRRYYRPSDMALLSGIKRLLHDEGLTIRGVQKILRDHGVRHVAGLADDSVSVEDLVAVPEPIATGLPDLAEPETAAEDAGNAPTGTAPVSAGPISPQKEVIVTDESAALPSATRSAPQQQVLPLFDLPATTSPDTGPIAPPLPTAATRRQPTLRDDASFASLVRGLSPKARSASAPELASLARRLAALRAQMANRAEGGQG
ncbi:MerR family transcriptional regulator [Tabrizicola sp.]|uniref:MerR family transcriptional regulator n=1 Tax=Tabrizicola sp. TaxID=2005166 RepID=UPI0026275FC5|nr:MerR family transcriptional regulator [Tabrizicola sp.]MDM7931076.1 MerR family transcriptional regulator [Tabrizicola sp.]